MVIKHVHSDGNVYTFLLSTRNANIFEYSFPTGVRLSIYLLKASTTGSLSTSSIEGCHWSL